ncbi:MAG TPA: class I SAM-dependent methyltransferase [Anaeromyxobacteraceae bacterium]|nr:class I SAM-dependent methyltransferase [Anaeromyxobacteraceae bacterium]
MRLAVTAALGVREPDLRAAEDAARRHSLPFVPRHDRPLPEVAAEAGADALAVLGAERVCLFLDGREHRWSAGMGLLRAKRLRAGERDTRDPFLGAAALRPGESVLDCTLGLCADALVASAAVGPSGEVVGLESSPALALLAEEGLRRLPDEAADRIQVRRADAAELLPALPPRSFDLVVFDPMFRHRRAQAPGFDLVRRLGDPRPLAAETLAQARRVARRAVLVKDGTPGWDLARLGLTPLPSSRGAHRLYARLDSTSGLRSRTED